MNQETKKKHECEDFYIEEQRKLGSRIDLTNCVDTLCLKYVAGVDLAYWKQDTIEYAVCCIVVLDYWTREIVEKKHCMGKIEVPYIPGCLAFREIDLVLDTIRLLEHSVGLYVFDGNGFLHPRHMGLATHAGILLGVPTIGVAKSYYKVENVDYIEPENKVFAYEDIVIRGEVYYLSNQPIDYLHQLKEQYLSSCSSFLHNIYYTIYISKDKLQN